MQYVISLESGERGAGKGCTSQLAESAVIFPVPYSPTPLLPAPRSLAFGNENSIGKKSRNGE
jgi:hypothetical protein